MKKRVLHVGFGGFPIAEQRPFFSVEIWDETTVDIDERHKPDLVLSMTDLAPVDSGSFDAVYTSHTLEHLFAHEVPAALREFRRVLRPDGFLFLAVPDLLAAAQFLVAKGADEPVYQSPAGPVAPLDMIFGMRRSIAAGSPAMAHRTGFTAPVLGTNLHAAGFRSTLVRRDPGSLSLLALCKINPGMPQAELAALMAKLEIVGALIPSRARTA